MSASFVIREASVAKGFSPRRAFARFTLHASRFTGIS